MENSVVSSLQTAFTSLQGDIIAAIGVIAPIALVICGTVLVWRFGVRFFKGLAK